MKCENLIFYGNYNIIYNVYKFKTKINIVNIKFTFTYINV